MDLDTLTIRKIRDGYKNGEFTPEELKSEYLQAIEKKNGELHAYLEAFSDGENEGDGVFAGVPLALKDNILIKGRVASASSKMLEHYKAVYDSTVTKKLKAAGITFLGRTNMDEFAMGSSTENSAYGPSKNPFDISRVPGGSSGGSAAAVAAGLAPAALGSDTGGSIRQPASLCGLVGLKPTYGAVSRFGLIAMGSSLDQIGPITKTVEDAELLFNLIRGHDPLDSTTLPDASYENKRDVPKHLTIGVPWNLVERDGIDSDVLLNFKSMIERLEAEGHEVKEVDLPHASYSLAVYYILMPAEVSSNLARLDGIRYGLRVEGADLLDTYLKSRAAGFGTETRRRIILGTYVLSAGYADEYYYKAAALREAISHEFQNVFEKGVDVIATPTTPSPAFKIGQKSNDPLAMYLEDVFTVPANIAGIPAISVPSGFVERDGVSLPIGLQFQASHTREDILFEAGRSLETIRGV